MPKAFKVPIINDLDIPIKLREGNSRIFQDLKTVPPGERYILRLDPNATYREYVLITLPDGAKVGKRLSSDDAGMFQEIRAKLVRGSDPPKYDWEGTLTPVPAGFFAWILKFLN